MASNRDKAVDNARNQPNTPPGPAAGCPNGCERQTLTREGLAHVDETISHALDRCQALRSPTVIQYESCYQQYHGWNLHTWWDARFSLSMTRANCTLTVTVKIKVDDAAVPITAAQKAAWKSAVEAKWNGKVKLVCPDTACTCACAGGYAVVIVLAYVDSAGEAHQTVTVQLPGQTTGDRAGLSGTTGMTLWGRDDTIDITHEFGHMLGNVEEYFTTNGTDYTNGGAKNGFRDGDGGIMNNPARDPLPRNYEIIRQETAKLLASMSCTIQPVQPVTP